MRALEMARAAEAAITRSRFWSSALKGLPFCLFSTSTAPITVCATLALQPFAAEPAALVRTRVLRVPPDEEFVTLGGRVVDESGSGLFDARVELVGTEMRARTDELGRYRLQRVPRGAFTLRVHASGFAAQDQPVVVPDRPPPFAITLHRP